MLRFGNWGVHILFADCLSGLMIAGIVSFAMINDFCCIPLTDNSIWFAMTSESILDQLGRLLIPLGNCLWNILNNIAIKDAQFILALVYRNPVVDCYLHLVCRCLSVYMPCVSFKCEKSRERMCRQRNLTVVQKNGQLCFPAQFFIDRCAKLDGDQMKFCDFIGCRLAECQQTASHVLWESLSNVVLPKSPCDILQCTPHWCAALAV